MATSTSALDSQYASAIGSTITSSAGSTEMDKQAFLMLLVTQFKYQDPLNPMEDKEFVAQLAQFSSLEQSMNMNTNLTNLIEIQQQSMVIGAANYIGKDVSARGYGISVTDGTASVIQYAAAEEIASGYVNILDTTTNTVLATIELGRKSSSIHDFQWDGKLNSGATAADGVYTVAFVAYNSAGERLLVDTSVTGTVTAVSSYNGEQYLRLSDGRTVLMSGVREVVGKTATTETSTTETSSSGDGGGDNGTETAEATDDSVLEQALAKFRDWLLDTEG